MAAPDTIKVEVAYAAPDRQYLIEVNLPAGSTVAEAIDRSGIQQNYLENGFSWNAVGIYGQLCTAEKILVDGDRVELYRPLLRDPMTARRQRIQSKSGA